MACKKETAARRKFKVCNRCGAENPLNISQCRSCGSSKFAPSWVRAKRPVNRQVSVEITAPNPQYGESAERVTLSKWWPGGRANFHLPNAGQWGKIESIINDDLGPALGWKTEKELVEAIHAGGKAKKPGEAKDNYRKLIEAHPDILKKLVGAIDPARLSGQEFERVVETLGEVSEALTSANAGFREAFTTVVRKLPRQKQRALEDLGLLLEGWSLQVVTNVAQQVKARIDTIELLDEQIQDEKTFDIAGDRSIHRILERAMWMIDERYWLLQSNNTLRKFIGNEMSKRDAKRYGKKRPDFVCGTVDNRLIILELKRPAHVLTVDDLNQLEIYTVVAEDHASFSSCEGYLIGAKEDEELRRFLKRRSGFKVLHYADIIGRTRQRYTEFLRTIEQG